MGRLAAIFFAMLMIGGCAKYPAPAVDMWSLGRREPIWKVRAEGDLQFTAMALSGDGRVFVARDDGKIFEWEVGGKAAKRKLESPEKWISAMAISPDGRWLATASGTPAEKANGGYMLRGANAMVRVWDLREGKLAADAETEIGATARLHFSPDSKYVALVSDGYFIDLKVWETPREVSRLKLVLISNRHVNDSMLTAFFESGPDGKMSLMALGRRWEISGENYSLKEQWEKVPGAMADRTRAFFAVGAEWDDRLYPWPVMVTPPGVLEQGLDGNSKRAFYKLPGALGGLVQEQTLVFANVADYRAGAGGEKGKLVWGTFLIDLTAGQYERLGCQEMERSATFGLAVSGKEYGACGAWGMAVWYLP